MQMLRVNTTGTAAAASVGRLMLGRRGRPMGQLAHGAVGGLPGAAGQQPDAARVAFLVAAEWPDQARVARMGNMRQEPFFRCARGAPAAKGVPMVAACSPVVPLRFMGPVTIRDGTNSSHNSG